ncbi:DNA/RNA polymerase, partial [Calocera viscosa TUFC12733]
KAGAYEPAQSAYRSSWFVVLKKNGTLRPVINLQPLNGVMIKSSSVPPITEHLIESYGGRSCYSLVDFYRGFEQHELSPESRDLTSFQSPLGPLRYCVAPMGAHNMPGIMQ